MTTQSGTKDGNTHVSAIEPLEARAPAEGRAVEPSGENLAKPLRARGKLVIGNWKMHGSLGMNAALLAGLRAGVASLSEAVRVAVCVPFPYLAQAQASLDGSRAAWGVQDVSAYDRGAYTGEVAASMAADFGARYAIVGHSERRAYHRESEALISVKTRRALAAALTPIVCVGETLEERQAGRTDVVVARQLEAVLEELDTNQGASLVLAYEPVWAIGTGRSASAAQAQSVHARLRAVLRAKNASLAALPILYGGSVKPDNADALFAERDIDGALIGGASLVANDFLAICAAAQAVLASQAKTRDIVKTRQARARASRS